MGPQGGAPGTPDCPATGWLAHGVSGAEESQMGGPHSVHPEVSSLSLHSGGAVWGTLGLAESFGDQPARDMAQGLAGGQGPGRPSHRVERGWKQPHTTWGSLPLQCPRGPRMQSAALVTRALARGPVWQGHLPGTRLLSPGHMLVVEESPGVGSQATPCARAQVRWLDSHSPGITSSQCPSARCTGS